jgi:hypothetical protein
MSHVSENDKMISMQQTLTGCLQLLVGCEDKTGEIKVFDGDTGIADSHEQRTAAIVGENVICSCYRILCSPRIRPFSTEEVKVSKQGCTGCGFTRM